MAFIDTVGEDLVDACIHVDFLYVFSTFNVHITWLLSCLLHIGDSEAEGPEHQEI